MATESMMLDLGTKAPAFRLPDTVTGDLLGLYEIKSETATVIMFICNHCPYVQHIQHELVSLAREYISKGVSFIAISSNDISAYPEDAPEKMKETAQSLGYPFPYLYDETQEAAKSFKAACTPDIYVFDKDLLLVYRGQFDDSRPGNNKPVTGRDLRRALDAILSGSPVPAEQIPSIGCSIKWKKPH